MGRSNSVVDCSIPSVKTVLDSPIFVVNSPASFKDIGIPEVTELVLVEVVGLLPVSPFSSVEFSVSPRVVACSDLTGDINDMCAMTVKIKGYRLFVYSDS